MCSSLTETSDSDSSEFTESWLWRLQPLVCSREDDLENRRYRAEEHAAKLRRRKIRNGVIVKPACKQGGDPSQEAYVVARGKHVNFKIAPVPDSQQSRAWDCSLAMVKYLETFQLEGLRVLELGCGLGLPGIASALLGAHSVHVTDRDILAAKETIMLNPSVKDIVKAYVLRWGSEDGLRIPGLPYDLVLGADILYTGDKASTTALVKTICDVCSFGTKLILMNERRWGGSGNSQIFLSCLRQAKFHVEEDVSIDEGSAIADDIGPEEGQMSLVIAQRIRWSEGG